MTTNAFNHVLLLKLHHRPDARAIRAAAELARRSRARLTIADLLPDGAELSKLVQSARLQQLEKLVAPHLGGREARFVLLSGSLGEALDAPEIAECDLVVPALGESLGGESERLGRELLRVSERPVWLAGTGRLIPERALAAVDLEPGNQGESLGRQVLRQALALGAGFGTRVGVLSVRMPSLADRLSNRALLREDELALRETLETEIDRAVEELPAGALRPAVELESGEPRDVIPAVARRRASDLLIIGHNGRRGLSGLLIGNTAERLCLSDETSILVVKPEGSRKPRRVRAA